MATKKPLKAAKVITKTAKPAIKASKPAVKGKTVVKVAKVPVKAAPEKAKAAKVNKVTPVKAEAIKKVARPTKKVVADNKKKIIIVSKPIAGKSVPPKPVIPEPKKSSLQVKKEPVQEKKATKPVAAPKAAVKKVETTVKPKAEAPKPVEVKATPVKVAAPKAVSKPVRPSKPVVIPKTSTDKKVNYEPDFLKSVLDAPLPPPQSPSMRYSDNDLNEFRDLINKKLEAAKKELVYLQGLITRRDEMGGDETDNRYMTMEDGGMSMEREQLSQMASRQITFIDHLEKAIMRIENKTYGICRVTGKLIDKARLRAVPHATLSMEAKLGITK